MSPRLLPALAAFLVLLLAPLSVQAEEGRYGHQKVVYHINYEGGDGQRAYLRALGNIQNHINAVGAENMEIKVVMHGDGVYLLRDALSNFALETRVVGLKGQNVSFQVCNNTLVGRDIDYSSALLDVWEDDIVPSGVAELSHLQQQG